MKKRFYVMLAVMVTAVLALSACGNGNGGAADLPDPGATGQDTITIVTTALAVSMDPIGRNDSASAQFNKQIFSHLVLLDYDTFEVLPALAINWDMPDARTVNMELRRDVTFHNGDRLTAHDVQFSLERAAVEPEVAAILGMMSHVTVHDDYNFTVHLEVDFAPILRHLAHTTAGIVPRDHFNAVGQEAFAESPIGSGPFMFDNLVLGDRAEIVRFPDYWGTPARVERIIFRIVPEASVRLAEVEVGTADVALSIAPADLATAEASPNVVLMRRQNLSTAYLGFNTRRPYLSNPLVRQAIAYALDWDVIVPTVFMGLGSPARGPMADIVWGFAEQPPFTTSLDRARELLAEAGYPDGFNTTIWWNIPNEQRSQISEMVQFTLSQIGITVEIEALEWGPYLDRTSAGEHDMFLLGWVSVTGDADYALHPLLHSSLYGPGGNRTFWSTPELDALLDEGRSEVDPDRRLEIYRRAQEIIRAEAPMLTFHQGETAVAVNPNLRGLTLNPADHHAYVTVWFE